MTNTTKRLKGRHLAKMLTDLESIGNIKEVDKTVIRQHMSNFASDMEAAQEQEGGYDAKFNK